jgi:hypothetical protein
MIAELKSKPTAEGFPEEQLSSTLQKWWAQEALERNNDPFSPVKKLAGTVYELLPALDSLAIVRSLLRIEEVLGMEVPVSLVKAGGYHSQQEMLNDLVPKLRRLYEKRKS